MKTFDEALTSEAKRHISDLEIQGCSDRERLRYLSWFKEGALYAETNPELINEILTKYHEWALNLPAIRFVKWDYEEVYTDKTKARIRKEFIEFLKREQ